MPLTLSRRPGSGVWQMSGTVAGQRVRESTGTADRRLAEEARAAREAELLRGAIYGREAIATWEDAVALYLPAHELAPHTARQLHKVTDFWGRKRLKDIDQLAMDQLIAALAKPGTAPATILRHIVSPVRAVLNYAARRKLCSPPMFEAVGKKGSKIDQARTRWLTPDEYRRLHAEMAPHLQPLLTFLVCTGARLAEALYLDWRDVDLRARTVRLRDTKNGSDRLIEELPPAALIALGNLDYPRRVETGPGQWRVERVADREGRVFRADDGTPYARPDDRTGGQIKTAWAGAVRRAGFPGEWSTGTSGARWWTPEDVTPHVMRHTWATWHHVVHRDLLLLKREGGWSSVTLVERYAKSAPAYLRDGILTVWGYSPDTFLPQSYRPNVARG